MKSFLSATLFSACLVSSTTQVAAQGITSLTCAEVNGRLLIEDAAVGTSAQAAPASLGYAISLTKGDQLTISFPTLPGGPVLAGGGASPTFYGQEYITSATINTGFAGTVPLPMFYQAPSDLNTFVSNMLTQRSFLSDNDFVGLLDAAVPVSSGERATAQVSCKPGVIETTDNEEVQAALGTTSAFTQNTSILSGLRGVRGQTSGGNVQVTQGTAMGFLGDDASGWRAWGFTDFRRYSDAATGSSTSVTLGLDRDIGGVRFGGLLSYDTTSLDDGSGEQDVSSLAIGPYVSGSTDTFNYDAFVTFSRPDYSLSTGDVTGERIAYGLAGEGVFDVGSTTMYPFLSLNGASEDLDGNRLQSRQVSAGVRVEFSELAGIDPYVSLAYENNHQDSALTGSTNHSAPRLGLGFSTQTASGGVFGVDIDAGESIENLRDVGMRLSYSFDF